MKRILPLIFAIFLLVACKENEEPVLHEESEEKVETQLVWEFSYSIDGVEYEGTFLSGFGAGVRAAYEVPKKTTFDEYDSLLFMVHTSLKGNISDGELEVSFVNKYPKEQFYHKNRNFITLYQEDRDKFIKEGPYPFSLDFKGHNSQDGVALDLTMYDEDGQRRWLTTYSTAFYGMETIVGEDAQTGSNFEILKVGKTPNGILYIEAKFHATGFGHEGARKTDFKKEVTDGFVRIPINYMDN